MGDMAELYDYYIWPDDYYARSTYNARNRYDQFRNNEWAGKDQDTRIKDMGDRHLLNAFKVSGDDRLRDEILIRLFEAKIQGDEW